MNKNGWRFKLYQLVDVVDETGDGEVDFDWYDFLMMFVIIISIIPLLFKNASPALLWIDKITVIIFIIDYFFRWITSDYRYGKASIISFIRYPFSFMALIDLLSIIPSLTTLNQSLKLLKLFRMLRTLKMLRTVKVLRVVRAARYSRQLAIIADVLKESKEALLAVCTLAIAYIFVSALMVFNVEPDTFNSFFDAIYWATVSLTTVGYGDIYPVSVVGRSIAMISSVFGIAIVALPAGIITAGYMNALQKKQDDENKNNS